MKAATKKLHTDLKTVRAEIAAKTAEQEVANAEVNRLHDEIVALRATEAELRVQREAALDQE